MRTSAWTSLVALGVSLVLSVRADAQPLFSHAESIEWTVANADRVVVGKIVGFGGGEGADEGEGIEATLAVEETLKGEHRQRLRVWLSRPASVLEGWKDRSRRLLVAVVGEEDSSAATVIELADEGLEVLTADFTLLRDPDEVIRVAKETVRRMPGVRRILGFALMVPNEAVAGTQWAEYYGTGGYLLLSVPVDRRLETRALEFLRSDSTFRREEGARALRYFRSAENIERVRALLDDPAWAYLDRAEENQGREVRIYVVRREAYRTLRYWGVDAEKPRIREELWMPERVRVADFSNRDVTEADLKGLARFENLESLFLWNVPVTDAQLREIGRLKTLRDVYLDGSKTTDAGLKPLAGLPDLRYLGLRGTPVTDEGLKILAGFESLRKVDLSQTPVTDEGVAALREVRPDLEIER